VEAGAVLDVATFNGDRLPQTLTETQLRVDDTTFPDHTSDRPGPLTFTAAR